MKKKATRHQLYVKPQSKDKNIKLKEDMHNVDDICDMDEMEDSDMDMCMDTEREMDNCKHDYDNMMASCDDMPECIMLAHAYVPWQYYEQAFTPPEALMKGTLFPELWGVYKIPNR
ncbi:spore coat associated protein CotJA [Sporomusa sphaeroides DSM 2875]|uniref:spore coat associated protein CotJA n=1 Tax=Sporomusa sphaeroides TaxID=47679 RepID=UPI00202E4EB7|nr:spore coat associated protein CotJA [Sporomusa sphaeroides DSM 2875]